jgi:hypothetical protein
LAFENLAVIVRSPDVFISNIPQMIDKTGNIPHVIVAGNVVEAKKPVKI